MTRTELITKTKEDTFGTRYVIEGGVEQSLEDIGAPDGTTFLVRQLFYNVPARRKFLKTPMTEAGHVQDLLMRLALSHPEVSFTFINNGQTKMRTSGNGKLKDVIYSIYGREAAANLIELDYSMEGLVMKGYLGKPTLTRGNRNFETYFVNGRYVKNAMLSKAIEDAYKDFLMQHKFPFVVIHFQVDGEKIDVNVHPTKMEMRFQRQQDVYNIVYEGVHRTLLEPELIPRVEAPAPKVISQPKSESPFLLKPKTAPQPMEKKPEEKEETHDEAYFMKKMKERVLSYHQRNSSAEVAKKEQIFRPQAQAERIKDALARAKEVEKQPQKQAEEQPTWIRETPVYETKPVTEEQAEQLNLFEEHLLKREEKAEYKLIGQVFETYWLVEFENSLYIIDQHAAHERVLYENEP